MSTPFLNVHAISKRYPGGVQALQDVSFTVELGEILCLLGPSGCGKSTLLRVVAGLEVPDQGRVELEGQDIAALPVHRRGFGFMFQDFALFPHRSVAENIAFGLRMAGWSREKQLERVDAMLKLVSLPSYGKRSIFELSGGERQRVALARSLAPGPALLMLDEPLGSLDRSLREELVEELRRILKEMHVAALYVTHDQDEAMALGDRMAIMQRGQIEQIDAPSVLYNNPATPFVARFLGFTNLLPATPISDGVLTPLGPFPLPATLRPTAMTLLLRPDAARLAYPPVALDDGFHPLAATRESLLVQGRLTSKSYHGSFYRIEVEVSYSKDGAASHYTLSFQLPSFQRNDGDNRLLPLQLPSVGAPICLQLYTNLATLLPYSA